MEYLASSFNVVSLSDLKQHLETATPFKGNTVAVTFDGGYSDVLYTAKGVLERFGIPATVFMPSASLMERTPFWWDVLEDLLIAGDGVCPRDRLVMEIDHRLHSWPLGNMHDRFKAFEDLYALLSDRTPAEQRELIAEIAGSMSSSGGERDRHATLGIQEVRRLEEGGLVTVGGHTHHCVKLSRLSEADQAREIRRNKQVLEEILGHEIEYFAYPFGDQDGPTTAATEMLKGMGFTLSCHVACDTVSVTGAKGCPTQGFTWGTPTSPYELPRLTIGDWNPFTFYRRLRAFFD
jgi:peptidoglycan/xylan/chitin deacetylase (PgdA/CDA1 family)